MGKPYIMRGSESFKQGLYDLLNYLELTQIFMAEIGCYTGESTCIFASSDKVEKVYAIDPWINGYDNTDPASYIADMNEIEKIFDDRIRPYRSKVVKIKKKSEEALPDLNNKEINFVYIDGNHQPEAIKQDIKNYLPIISPNGYIGGHDWKPSHIVNAILESFGREPDMTFKDRSWVYKV